MYRLYNLSFITIFIFKQCPLRIDPKSVYELYFDTSNGRKSRMMRSGRILIPYFKCGK